MPFEKKADGTTAWREPSNEEIVKNRREIVEAEASGVHPELTQDLRDKLDEAVNELVPGHGWGVIASSNTNLYKTIKSLTSTAQGLVDIIIPVFNSIHIVESCIETALKRTHWPFHITIVDDSSDSFTHKKLEKLAKHPKISLITNANNRGFAASVNRGMKATNGEYICFLNSDVLVTPLWLTKMLMALKADPRNQIVCPSTNNTAVVNIPMSDGASYLTMNKIFEGFAIRKYPEIMPTGFCFLFQRSLIDKIGYLDEAFENFGEESDYWMKAVAYVEGDDFPRYRAVMADDTYVFHERGASFASLGEEAHMQLRKMASGRFHQLWPHYAHWKKSYNEDRVLGHLREKIPAAFLNTYHDAPYRICWVVHSVNMCGAMRYIADIVNEINERGGDARVVVVRRESDQGAINPLGELRAAPVVFNNHEEFLANFEHHVFHDGIVVASTSELASVVMDLCSRNTKLSPLLHVQSYEPVMVQEPELIEQTQLSFKKIPAVISSSKWITKELKTLGVKPFATVLPGVDCNLFYGRGRGGDTRPTVMIPMIGNYEFKGYARGLELITALENHPSWWKELDGRILVYGTPQLAIKSNAICLGTLSQVRLANLLGSEVDVFIDPSHIHSYGMPALEAMVSGVDVVTWDNKGIHEYAKDGKHCEIHDANADPKFMAQRIIDLLQTRSKNSRKFKLPLQVDRKESVAKFIEEIETNMKMAITGRRIVVVTPHLRKHGGPTTILNIANGLAARGHDVSITTVYSDISPEVVSMTELPVSIDPHNIPKCDILLTNSDNPMNDVFAGLGSAKKKIMLKLSHNERFKALEEKGLQQKWDKVITTTSWLKDVCEKPTEGWDYPPTPATRVGWWNYGFETMKCEPHKREYGDGKKTPINIGTLVHRHPLKGTKDAVRALGALCKKYGNAIHFIGIGEIPPSQFNAGLPYFKYRYAPNRADMAELFKTMDIWVSASHTEGLGRMALEAMSAGVTCVLADTGAEFAKHGENCLLFPIGDVNAMAKAMDTLLTDYSLMAKLRENGYNTARAMADPGPCMEAIQAVIDEICDV